MEQVSDQAEIVENSRPVILEAIWRRVGKVAALGIVAASGVVIGAFHDPVEGQLGPHKVEATMTLDSYLTADLGPFDSLDIPIDLPVHAGTDVVVKGNTKTEINAEDYARFLSDPSDDIESLKNKFKQDALPHAAIAVGGYLALGYLTDKDKRRARWEQLNSYHVPQIASAFALVMGSFVATGGLAKSESTSAPVDSIFDGTVLEGARANGVIMQKLLNEVAPEVISLINENDEFYRRVAENLQEAAKSGNLLTGGEQLQTAIFYTDNHCNLGMAKIIGELERLSGAELIFDGGDVTMSGTEFEAQCMAVIADATKSPIVFAAGNHDSETIEKQASKRGFEVLDGKIIEVGGISILGDDDPRKSEPSQEIELKGSENVAQVSERLARVACDPENKVDVLLVHDEAMAQKSLDDNCVGLVLSGHSHKHKITQTDAGAVSIVGGSAGGKMGGGSTYGPLRGTAELIVKQFDRDLGRYTRSQHIKIFKNTSVTFHSPSFAGSEG